ncbi:MAG: hypothetical protein HYX22_02645 [Candidatus Yanofskybacteria bacterium]|nr:hypothetical protein [Candidatus Yanofskybacteria bacterium]
MVNPKEKIISNENRSPKSKEITDGPINMYDFYEGVIYSELELLTLLVNDRNRFKIKVEVLDGKRGLTVWDTQTGDNKPAPIYYTDKPVAINQIVSKFGEDK